MPRISTGQAYRAFLSYSHADDRFATWLHRRLEAYRLPRGLEPVYRNGAGDDRRLAPVFRDRVDLGASAELSTALHQALESSDALVVLCTPSSASSAYVDEEVRLFQQMGRADRIVPVLVGAATPEQTRASLPPSLGALDPRTLVSFATASDAASRRHSFVSLAARLFGVSAETLQQHEVTRQRKRFAGAAAILSTIVLALGTLAVLAWRGARRADALAVAEADARSRAGTLAELERTSRDEAEDLVAFMLDDLHNKLAQTRRIDVLRDVAQRCMRHYESVEPSSADAKRRQASAFGKIGMIGRLQGDVDASLRALSRRLEITAELASADEASVDDHAQYLSTLGNLGTSHLLLGDTARAMSYFDRMRAKAREAHARFDDPQFRAVEAIALVRIAQNDVMNRPDLRPQALGRLNSAIKIFEETASDEDANLLVGMAYSLRGSLREDEGDLRRGARLMDDARSTTSLGGRELLDRDVAWAHWVLGGYLCDRPGRAADARKSLARAEELARPLAQADESNADIRFMLFGIKLVSAAAAKNDGDRASAAKNLEEAVEALTALCTDVPGQLAWEMALISGLNDLGELREEGREYDAAIAWYERAVRRCTALGRHPMALDSLSRAYNNLGDALRETKAFDKALAAYRRGADSDRTRGTSATVQRDLARQLLDIARTIRIGKPAWPAPPELTEALTIYEDLGGPDGPRWVRGEWMRLSYALKSKRDSTHALEAQRKALAISRELVARVPDHVGARQDLLSDWRLLGQRHVDLKQGADALAAFEKVLDLAARGPAGPDSAREVIYAWTGRADVWGWKDREKELGARRKCYELCEALARGDVGNTLHVRMLMGNAVRLGLALKRAKNMAEALPVFRRAAELAHALKGRLPKWWREQLYDALEGIADTSDDDAEIVTALDEAQDIATSFANSDLPTLWWNKRWVVIQNKLALRFRKMSLGEKALAVYRRMEAFMVALGEKRPAWYGNWLPGVRKRIAELEADK